MEESVGGIILSNRAARTKEQAIKLANDSGLEAFFPLPYELMLDFDEPYDSAVIRRSAEVLHSKASSVLRDLKTMMFLSLLWTKSKSGNAHLWVFLNVDLDDMTRSFAQAILGSDPAREVFNYVRLQESTDDKEYAMALFETKEEAAKVREWRRKCGIERNIYKIQKAKAHAMPESLGVTMRQIRKRLGL